MSSSHGEEMDTVSEPEMQEGQEESTESREQDPNQATNSYGGLLGTGDGGVTVNDFMAVSVGLDRFVQPRHFASLLFAASEGKMPWISSLVPQKVMVNSVFVVDTKSVETDGALLRDGLGAWIQNCGKVINHYVYDNGEAREVKPGQDPESFEFVRRIDKNANCTTFTRVIVHCPALALAAYQYFFKGEPEHEFDVSYKRPKRNGAQNSFIAGIRHPAKKKRKNGEDDDESSDVMEMVNGIPITMVDDYKVGQPVRFVVPGGDSEVSSLITYLKTHLTADKYERSEERKVRREEMLALRKEREDERKLMREELDMRRAELKFQQDKLALEQEKWEADRKEKDLMVQMLQKVLQKGK